MGIIDEFIADGVGGWFGDILGLLRAVGSLFGVILVLYGVVRLMLKVTGFVQVKTYGMGALISGSILVLVFGWSYGLEYFEIYPL
jgi:membrane-anchored glycerophosphoryl diester phosphodiesterase (GDPDase)